MKLIVDIPDEGYDWIKNGFPDNEDKEFLIKAIANGTPLPKGHGDLIDRNELSPKIHGAKSIVAVLEAPTIVEADKESDNETDS